MCASAANIRTEIIDYWLKSSSDNQALAGSTSAPFYGANCAGAVLLGLGITKDLMFILPERMDREILPKCFEEVDIARPGDIGALQLAGGSIHFFLILDSSTAFNKWDIGAPFERVSLDKVGCLTPSLEKRPPFCNKIFRLRADKPCSL